MELRTAFAQTLRSLRAQLNLSQEDFSVVSSRTNVSLIERAKTIPTLEKLEHLCTVLNVHPLTVMTLCYAEKDGVSADALLSGLFEELRTLGHLGGGQAPRPAPGGGGVELKK
jgi:transcriptional regulator with XRE-family HTH domain